MQDLAPGASTNQKRDPRNRREHRHGRDTDRPRHRSAIRVYRALLIVHRRHPNHGHVFPSQATLAGMLSMRRSTVGDAIRSLKQAGWITISKCRSLYSSWLHNVYELRRHFGGYLGSAVPAAQPNPACRGGHMPYFPDSAESGSSEDPQPHPSLPEMPEWRMEGSRDPDDFRRRHQMQRALSGFARFTRSISANGGAAAMAGEVLARTSSSTVIGFRWSRNRSHWIGDPSGDARTLAA